MQGKIEQRAITCHACDKKIDPDHDIFFTVTIVPSKPCDYYSVEYHLCEGCGWAYDARDRMRSE